MVFDSFYIVQLSTKYSYYILIQLLHLIQYFDLWQNALNNTKLLFVYSANKQTPSNSFCTNISTSVKQTTRQGLDLPNNKMLA